VERFPDADIVGVDSSIAMLEAARRACPGARFESGDLSDWSPGARPDLLFSNAAFQWVPDHVGVLVRLAQHLAGSGVLAVQMPDNLMEPSHTLMQLAAEQGPWAAKLSGAAGARQKLPSPSAYYGRLKPHFRQIEIWHTIYNHPLDGVDGIVSWLMSTGLRPYLDPLNDDERRGFLMLYRELLAERYPLQEDGKVLLRFPRLFIVGVR
jgi:trans-aconitate 2-methyltransferase